MTRLVAIDMDDTTLMDDHTLGQRTIDAILGAQRQGITVVPATGRAAQSVLPYVQQLGLSGPVISYQGARISTLLPREQVWLQHDIPVETIMAVLGKLKPYGVYVHAYNTDGIIYERECEQSRSYTRLAHVQGRAVGNLEKAIRQPQIKLLSMMPPELATRLQLELSEYFRGQLTVTISKPTFLEFTHPLANKGQALAYVAGRLGVAQRETAAVGDSLNDISMVRWAGLGCAVDNAREELKQAADRLLPGNQHQGVAQFLEELARG